MRISPSALFKACSHARLYSEKPENIIKLDRMIDIVEGRQEPIGHFPGYAHYIGSDTRFVYSVEEHKQKDGSVMEMRHCSISIDPMPSQDILVKFVSMVADKLGFVLDNGCKSFVEDLGRGKAFNLVQPVQLGKPLAK